jgi:hypothetical protein
MFLRKYGTGTGADVIIPIIKRGVVDFAVTADWTPAAGDVKVSKDGAAEANIATLPVINGTVGWKFVFSDAELQCKSLTIRVVDSATKAVEDQFFVVETYGNASAMFQADWSAANLPANVIQISGDATAADNAEAFFDGTGYAGTNNVMPTVTTLTNLPAITTNWLTAAGLAADAVTEIQSGLATATNVSDAQTAIIAQVDANETKIDAVKAKTDNLPSDPADQSAVEAAITAATSPLATAANLATVAGYLDTEIAAILADTNELQSDWADGGRLDLILDARSSQASVDDLPTNAELATALGTADDAVLAAIATVQADTDNIQTRLPAALESGRIAAALDSAGIDAIWNEVLTGATHNIASSAGRRLRQLADTVILVDGVCDAASNAGTDSTGTITLEVGTTTACIGQAIRCENQVRFIASYDAGTRVAQLDRPWCVVPDAGDEYVIFNVRNPLVGLASLALAGSTAAVVNDINAVTEKVDTGLVLDGAVYQFTENMLELGPSGGGGGGDATLAKQEEILAALQGVEAIQVASPNVQGNLVLTQGDDYDGVANPKASWTVTTDYTSGWTVRLTIRSAADAVIYTNTGSVVSSTVVAVTIAAPTGLTMTGCPGQWQGKFDVELTHSSGKKKTIALGVCYINEDQTR